MDKDQEKAGNKRSYVSKDEKLKTLISYVKVLNKEDVDKFKLIAEAFFKKSNLSASDVFSLIDESKDTTQKLAYDAGCFDPNKALMNCISECKSLSYKDDSGFYVILNQDNDPVYYLGVKRRVDLFRKHFGLNGKIVTECVSNITTQNQNIVFKASIFVKIDNEWVEIQNAYSGQDKNKNIATEENAVEFAETSAIGRCFTFLGIFNEILVKEGVSESEEKNGGSDDKKSLAADKSKNNSLINDRDIMISAVESSYSGKGFSLKNVLAGKKSFVNKELSAKKVSDLSNDDLLDICNKLEIDLVSFKKELKKDSPI